MGNYEITFSPTGGTKKVSEIISKVIFENKKEIDLTDRKIDFSKINLQKEDVALISVPSYGGRVPKIALERLKKIKGNKGRAIIVCVYGNREYEDTMVELDDNLKDEFTIIAGITAIAEHSIARKIAKNRPDNSDVQKLIEYSNTIKEKIKNGDCKHPSFKGNRPYRNYSSSKFIPVLNGNCVSCNLCVQKCPVNAINLDKEIEKDKCISCMRCISVCKNNARNLPEELILKVETALKNSSLNRKEIELYI